MVQLVIGRQAESTRRMSMAAETERVALNCSFLADPQPSVTWLLNGMEINTEVPGRYEVEIMYENAPPIGRYSEILIIQSVAMADGGNYTCRAQNEHSNIQQPTEDTQPLEVIGQRAFGGSFIF